jgi:hypothetical protein
MLFLLGLGGVSLAETFTKSADQGDGSRAEYVHIIGLYPEDRTGDRGEKITPRQDHPLPFSTRWTCGYCHDYGMVQQGRHFNATDPNSDPGRPGEPWIYADARLLIQIPLSYRPWPGTYQPAQFGLDNYAFVQYFGRHMAGGGPGEKHSLEPEHADRLRISGRLEINCLACHSTDPRMDMGGVAGHADQVRAGNFRWAATSVCGFASVHGSVMDLPETFDPFGSSTEGPVVQYQSQVFDDNNDVYVGLTKEIPTKRCYYCHSRVVADPATEPLFMQDEDVHMARGLTCVDCHRNGIDHRINRGYDNESPDPNRQWTAELTCEGCHLGTADRDDPGQGRLGAPVPKHKGIPAVHFEALTCTACHTGPWPSGQTVYMKTSRAHALGSTYVKKDPLALPHILSPVFARGQDGRIGLHNLMWPAFWGLLRDDRVEPISLDIVEPVLRANIRRSRVPQSGDWPKVTDEDIIKVLRRFASHHALTGEAVYIAGGYMHHLDQEGGLISEPHGAASPTLWPMAHAVRPGAQSLGVQRCRDCHDTKAAFFTGHIKVDTPLQSQQGRLLSMMDLMDLDETYTRLFGWSFIFRPWLKILGLLSGVVLAVLLVIYGTPCLANRCMGLPWIHQGAGLLAMASLLVLGCTGFWPFFQGNRVSGYGLMLHVSAGGFFAVMMMFYTLGTVRAYKMDVSRDTKNRKGLHWGIFWIMIISACLVILSVILNLFPWFDLQAQYWLLVIHRYSAMTFTAVVVIHVYGLIHGRREKKGD